MTNNTAVEHNRCSSVSLMYNACGEIVTVARVVAGEEKEPRPTMVVASTRRLHLILGKDPINLNMILNTD